MDVEKELRLNEKLNTYFAGRCIFYIDKETFAGEFVSVPEHGGDKLIPEGIGKPGHVYTVSHGDSGMIGVYKLNAYSRPARHWALSNCIFNRFNFQKWYSITRLQIFTVRECSSEICIY